MEYCTQQLIDTYSMTTIDVLWIVSVI